MAMTDEMKEWEAVISMVDESASKLKKCKVLFTSFIGHLESPLLAGRLPAKIFSPSESASDIRLFDLPGATAYVRLLWDGREEESVIVYGFVECSHGGSVLMYNPVCHVTMDESGQINRSNRNISEHETKIAIHLNSIRTLCKSTVPKRGEPLQI